MTITLTSMIAEYFAADREKSAEAVSRCFSPLAVVKDEGKSYAGRDAIRQWASDSSRKYSYTVEPFSISTEGNRTIVVAHLAGDFPASPVDLRYQFILDDGKIAGLEIAL